MNVTPDLNNMSAIIDNDVNFSLIHGFNRQRLRDSSHSKSHSHSHSHSHSEDLDESHSMDNYELSTIVEYESILTDTIDSVYIWICAASLMQFWYSCSWYIWILYGRSLGETDQKMMAIVTYTCYFLQGIFTLFWASMGDKYSYERICTLLVFMISIAYLIQFFATSFIQLSIGAILVSLCEGTWALSIAFIAKYLPLELSIKYTSYQYAIGTLFYILGPIAGGIISYYVSYSWCFMVSAISSGIVFTLLIIQNIRKNEENIQLQQIQFSNQQQDQHLKFPICIDKNQDTYNNYNVQSNIINGFWRSINCGDWFLLICVLIASSAMFAIEAILAVYYTVFVSDLFPEDDDIVMIATLQIAVYCGAFIFGVRIVPKLLELQGFVFENNFKFEYGVLVILQGNNQDLIPQFLPSWLIRYEPLLFIYHSASPIMRQNMWD